MRDVIRQATSYSQACSLLYFLFNINEAHFYFQVTSYFDSETLAPSGNQMDSFTDS